MSKLPIIDQMLRDIAWLDKHKKSENAVALTAVIDSLSIAAVTLGEQVSDAYEIMNNLEDTYDIAKAKFMDSFDGSNAAAKTKADADEDLIVMRRNFTEAKNVYKRVNMFLDRIDKVCDSHRQRISVVKQTDMKNL